MCHSQAVADFKVASPGDEIPILDLVKAGHYYREDLVDPDLREYFVPVNWLQTVAKEQGVQEIGIFGKPEH